MKDIKFESAAIRFYDPVTNEFKIYTGRRHHEIIKHIHDDGLTMYYKKYHVDGFIINGVFHDRLMSTKIAQAHGIPMVGCELTSEDLW